VLNSKQFGNFSLFSFSLFIYIGSGVGLGSVLSLVLFRSKLLKIDEHTWRILCSHLYSVLTGFFKTIF